VDEIVVAFFRNHTFNSFCLKINVLNLPNRTAARSFC